MLISHYTSLELRKAIVNRPILW